MLKYSTLHLEWSREKEEKRKVRVFLANINFNK